MKAKKSPEVKKDIQREAISPQNTGEKHTALAPAMVGVDEATRELAKLFFQFKRSETSSASSTQMQNRERTKELVRSLKQQNIRFYGIISKCWIRGNDCHLLNAELEILQHFDPQEAVPEGFEKVRPLISSLPPQVIALIVYSHQVQYLFLDGSLQIME